VSSKVWEVQLSEYIDRLTLAADKNGIVPILQIEAHGSDDRKGLVLRSGELVTWQELETRCRKLNIATQGNLILVMATCFGAYSSAIFSFKDRAPFWAVVGPMTEISSDQLLSSFSRLYTYLYDTRNVNRLLDALDSGPRNTQIKIFTAEWLFVKAYRYLIENLNTDVFLAERIANIKACAYERGLPEATPINDEAVKHELLKFTEETTFNELLRYYFMVDLYPANSDKFTITFDTLLKKPRNTITR
jgi:hypothetical protein